MTNMLPGYLGRSFGTWFRSPKLDGRVRGAGYILADGTVAKVDLTNWSHRTVPVGAVGYVLEGRNHWSAEVWSVLLDRAIRGVGATPDLAILDAAKAISDEETRERLILNNPEAHLERELSRHDWWGCMSDSFGVEQAADRHMKEVIAPLLTSVPADIVRALWSKHAPMQFSCPV